MNNRIFQMKKWMSKAIALLLCAAMLALLFSFGHAAAITEDELDSLKSKASALEEQEAGLKNKLTKLDAAEDSKLEEKALLEEQISVLSAEIANSEKLIAQYDVEIEQNKAALQEAKQIEEAYYDLFCERVRNLEEQTAVSYWAILFQASSFSDLLDRIIFVGDVVRYDNSVYDQLEQARQDVETAQLVLEENYQAQCIAAEKLEAQNTDLNAAQAAVDAAIEDINNRQDATNEEIAALQKEMTALEDEIARGQSEYDAMMSAEQERAAQEAEAEAERKAKEAAEAAAAEEAARKEAEAAEEAAKRAEEERRSEEEQEAARKEAEEAAAKAEEEKAAAEAAAEEQKRAEEEAEQKRKCPVQLTKPISHYSRISSYFGTRESPGGIGSTNHRGVDYAAPTGTNILAAADGIVTTSAYSPSAGNYIVIAHGNGVCTVYMHCSALYVSEGERVSAGENIAAVGSTGNSTGPHLHFGLMIRGEYVDPFDYL